MENILETVVEDSVNDALDTSADVDTSTTDAADTTATDSTPTEAVVDAPSPEVQSPGAAAHEAAATTDEDEFAKKFGLQSQSITGRENRIPYSRVKKIVARAEKEAEDRAKKALEGTTTPQLTEFQTKIRDYEERLTRVGQFEHILENDPKQFLSMLSQIPAYKEFFDYIQKAATNQPATQEPQNILSDTGMPAPDEVLPDGTSVYSMKGLRARDEWLARQIEERAVKQAEDRMAKRYAPIEQEWQTQQRIAQTVPIIEKQIAEARTWPNFTELESEIVAALKADQNLSLDRAYMQVYHHTVTPKLQADRNRIRTEVLGEIKAKPMASSAPVSQTRPGAAASGTPRSLEEIIAESVATLK